MCKCSGHLEAEEHVDLKRIKLQQYIEGYKGEKGALIPVLQQAQVIYGYLSVDVMETVAKELKKPVAEVYGVATFYAQFRFEPTGRNVIRVCMGTACHVRGALKVLKSIERELDVAAGQTTGDGRFTLETVACIGACGLAPVLSINNKAYGNMTPERVPDLLAQYE